MSNNQPAQITLLSGDAASAVAEVDVGTPGVRLRVQLTGVTIGGKRTFSVYTTCPQYQKSKLSYTVRFHLPQAKDYPCAAMLPELLKRPEFLDGVVGPFLERMQAIEP